MNLYSNIPADLPEELVETLLRTENLRIERIASHGHATSNGCWYEQDQDEWVVVLRGEAKLCYDGDEPPVELKPGDWVNIPAHKKHRVEWTTSRKPTIWLAVHYGDQR